MSRPKAAPYSIGTRVRYLGPGWQQEGGAAIRTGDVGVVIRVSRGMPDPGDSLGGVDGASIVEFHEDPKARRAVRIGDPGFNPA